MDCHFRFDGRSDGGNDVATRPRHHAKRRKRVKVQARIGAIQISVTRPAQGNFKKHPHYPEQFQGQ